MQDTIFLIEDGACAVVGLEALPSRQVLEPTAERSEVWEILGSLTGWHIWKARCQVVFGGECLSVYATLAELWTSIIHSLRGRWDQVQGDSRARQELRLHFLLTWGGHDLFFTMQAGSPRWRYTPPPWLLAPILPRPP